MARTLKTVRELMEAASVSEPLRFTALLTDGETLTAYRWACDGRPPSLYFREGPGGIVVVSEPIDGCREGWQVVPKGATLRARHGTATLVQAPEPARAAA
jgi:glutamine amidotransferase